MTKTQLDLSQLAVDRSPMANPATSMRRSPWLTRYAVPAAILTGFLALLAAAAGRRLLPMRSVQIVSVVVRHGNAQQSGSPLFQAAGWVEPRPTSISVAALAPGVIEQLHVVEGQAVNQDDPIARLISVDAEIAAKQAEAALAIADGGVSGARAAWRAAKLRLEKPIHLQVQLAAAQSELAKSLTELAKLPFLLQSAEATLKYTRSSVEGKRSAGLGVPGVVLQRVESELAIADANVRELRTRAPNLQNESKALQDKVDALTSQLDFLIEETRVLEEADARVQSALGLRDAAKLRLQQANLTLQRNVVRAPISGRILRLVASPGTRVMGLDTNAGQSSSTVVEMYDPTRLQVRADVRLEDVPFVMPGQTVQIETASSNHVIQGRVLQPNSIANIQKNTLEVKVELIEPPPTVRPEMLVTATFLAPESVAQDADERQAVRLFVPQQLVQTSESASFVWIVAAHDRAQRREIVLGNLANDGLVEVTNGLTVTDKMIASGTEGLKSGAVVRVTGDESLIGVN